MPGLEGQVELLAPTLWEYEVGNFLGREFPEEAMARMTLLLDFGIKGVPLSRNMVSLCLAWMKQNGVTFYDAAYLAVAAQAEAVLVAADERFAERMRHTESICLLKNL